MEDLWNDLQDKVPDDLLPSNMSLKDIMDTWCSQTGYPVITVTRDYEANSARITQVINKIKN